MNQLTIDQQQELIATVERIHDAGLLIIPLLFIVTFAAVLFTRRNHAGNVVLAGFFFLVLVLVGSCPEPITKLWLALTAIISGSAALLLQSLRQSGLTFNQWLANRLNFHR